MASKLTLTSEKLNENWVKAALALKYTKEGLEDTVNNALFSLHKTLLSDISTQLGISEAKCTNCTTTQICVEKKPCPNGICDKLRTKIISHHRRYEPNWRCTDATKWCTNHFEIAKCFLPAFICADTTSVKDINLWGLLLLAKYCRDIQSNFDADIVPLARLFSKVNKTG